MKIILISPYPDIHSFGVRSVSACLKKSGHEVKLLFFIQPFTKRYHKKALAQLAEFSQGADLIGISLMTNFFDNVVQITQCLKKEIAAPILWGGIHPTVRPEECLNYADLVCLGEAEETVKELAQKMERKEDYAEVEGLGFKRGGEIIINRPRPLIQNLDEIPFQDHDYETHFILDDGQIRPIKIEDLKFHLGVTYSTMPTRGCPFRCAYCCNNAINRLYPAQKLPRKRSVDNIIEELSKIKAKLPFIRVIKFDDDSFFYYSTEEIVEFSRKYKEKIGLSLVITGASPSTISREKLSALVEAGLYSVRMGIQTGNDRTKKLYQRPQSNQIVKEGAQLINQFKEKMIPPQYDIILDNPWESDDDLIETLMFLTEIPVPYALSIFSLNFYPGTELYEKAKAEGLIKDDLKDVYRKHFHQCRKTYLNQIFFLLGDYARIGFKIPPKLIVFLTQKKIRQSKRLNKVFFALVGFLIWFSKIIFKLKRWTYLARRGVQALRGNDFTRISDYLRRQINYLAKG